MPIEGAIYLQSHNIPLIINTTYSFSFWSAAVIKQCHSDLVQSSWIKLFLQGTTSAIITNCTNGLGFFYGKKKIIIQCQCTLIIWRPQQKHTLMVHWCMINLAFMELERSQSWSMLVETFNEWTQISTNPMHFLPIFK